MESNLRYMRPPSQKEKEFGTIQWCWTSVYESVYSSSVHVSQRPETSWNLSVTCPSLITVCLHTEDCAIMKPWQRRGQSPLSNAEFQSGWGGGKRSPRCCRVHTPLKPRQRSAVLFSDGNYAPNRGSVASGRGTPWDPVEPRNFCLDWAVTAQGLFYCPGPSICMSCGMLPHVTAVPGCIEHYVR